MTPDGIQEIIIGTTAGIGAIVYGLNKIGIWKFVEKANGKTIKTCSVHKELINMLTMLKDNQLVNTGLIKQHEKEFTEGNTQFDEIQKQLKKHGESLAVLLDRSKRWKEEDD